ncbi:MAG: FkbM family methyltransferase [Proteobacteria bacterium]|nr:FkbM family methyltransferase [Pseudomonadota bacterium]
MTTGSSSSRFRQWRADRAWKAGDRLDRLGRWLLVNAPVLGRLYAGLLTGRCGEPRLYPGWSFGYEYYIQRRWRALRRGALWEFAQERGLEVPLVVPWHGGTRVEVTLGNDMSLCLFVAGSFEPNEFAFLDRVLKPGMTFVDVGANEGLFTLFAARRVGAAGRVVAAEPSSRERRRLESNLARNRIANVTVVPHAIGDSPGSARLQIATGVHAGHNTLGAFTYADVNAVDFEDVPVETLDALAARLPIERVDVVKIDVEGAELKVLQGAADLLRRTRPILLIEANEGALQGQGASSAEVVALLESLGFAIHVFSDRTGEVEPRAAGAPLSANIVAMPR